VLVVEMDMITKRGRFCPHVVEMGFYLKVFNEATNINSSL
jgi:hypothetical protein